MFIVAVNAPPAEFVPEEHRFQPGYAVLLAGFGGDDEHAGLCQRARSAVTPLFELVDRMPYVGCSRCSTRRTPGACTATRRPCYLEELTDEAIAVIVEQIPRKNSPLSFVAFLPFGGAYQDVGADDTAFGGPRSGYGVYAIGLTETREQLPAERAWVRSFWQALQPHARGIGSYVNTMVELDEDRVRASYGPAKYARLAAIKRRYDPDNLFHLNANIKPAGSR